MTNSNIRSIFEIDSWRKIFETLLKGGMTARQIQLQTGLRAEDCSQALAALETNKAVIFSEGKWIATEEGKNVYNKFFA